MRVISHLPEELKEEVITSRLKPESEATEKRNLFATQQKQQ